MFDTALRHRLDPTLQVLARWVDRPPVTADRLTLLGLALGLGSAATAALAWWWVALVLWLLSRVCDGLDGPLARRRRHGSGSDSQAGGFLDITADFVSYGSTVLGVAVGVERAFGTSWVPFAAVLLAYYVNGAAFLAFSSIAERTGRQIDDGRSLSFLGGLAEGAETIAVHSLWLILPASAGSIAWVWAGLVALSAGQRMIGGYRTLRATVTLTGKASREKPDDLG